MSGGPLAGIRVVVTRGVAQGVELAAALAAAGAQPLALPLLEVVPPPDSRPLERAATELPLYDWLVLSSANAVEAFLPIVGGAVPARLRVAAVGPATARALAEYGIVPDLVAARSRAEGLLAALAPRVARRRVLLPQAADARATLAEGLNAAGAEVTAVVAYAKRPPADCQRRLRDLAAGPLGWVTFTSPSTVTGFADGLGGLWVGCRPSLLAASIGPVTSAALRERSVEPAAEARQPGARELVEAIERAVAS